MIGKLDSLPPIVPAADEKPVLGVAVWSIHKELEQCMSDAAALLGGEAHASLRVHIEAGHTFFSPQSGYVLRADFTRSDMPPPLINRIVCWHGGQLIVSGITAPPLDSEESQKAVAVPAHHP